MNLHEDHRNPEIDAGLHGLSDRLDELGAFEGRAADAGLEERLTRAVGGVFGVGHLVTAVVLWADRGEGDDD